MRKLFSALFACILAVGLVACNNGEGEPAPMIVIDGNNYFAYNLEILTELPEGYVYSGELSEEELKYASIEGNQYYTQENQDVMTDFFVYQECGTRVDETLVDSAQRQWAYLKWILAEE